MTPEQIAAFAMAEYVRQCALEEVGELDKIGDPIPVDEWRYLYALALAWAKIEPVEANPLYEVHLIRKNLIGRRHPPGFDGG